MVKIGGPKTTFVSQVRIRSELSDNHSGMTYLTFSECVHDAIPSGDLALQVNSSSYCLKVLMILNPFLMYFRDNSSVLLRFLRWRYQIAY